MNALREFFSPEAGQARTKALYEATNALADRANYWLGPAAKPINTAMVGANYLSDTSDIREAGQSYGDMFRDPSLRNATRLATSVGAAAIPVASAKMMADGVDVFGDFIKTTQDDWGDFGLALERFAKNQDGSVPILGKVDAPFDMSGGMGNPTMPSTDPLDIYRAPAGSRPEYLGAQPDRSKLTHLRYRPKKLSAKMQAAKDAMADPSNPTRQQIEGFVDSGQDVGDSWYNTEEYRDWFIAAHGEEKGDALWREAVELMGPMSPGSDVMANIGNASAIRNQLHFDPSIRPLLEGIHNKADSQAAKGYRLPGYGHKVAETQDIALGRYLRGEWDMAAEPNVTKLAEGSWTDNPKPKGFNNSFFGNTTNMAGDLHFTRTMAKGMNTPDWLSGTVDVSAEFRDRMLRDFPDSKRYFDDGSFINAKGETKGKIKYNAKKATKEGGVPIEAYGDYPAVWQEKPTNAEYAAFEDIVGDLAEGRGKTPFQYQAGLWMGAADQSGVANQSRGTFMELLRRRAAIKAKNLSTKTNKVSMEEVLDEHIRNFGKLATGGAAAGIAGSQPEETNHLRSGI